MTPRNRRSKLHDIQQIADSLRSDTPLPGDGAVPDFTDAILRRVDAQRPFLTHRTRRLVAACRYGAAAAVLLAVGGIVLVQATSPRIAELAAPIQPVTFSPAVDAVRETTAQAVDCVRRGWQELNTLTDPARTMTVVFNCVEQPSSAGPTTYELRAASPPDGLSRSVQYVLTTLPSGDPAGHEGAGEADYWVGYGALTSSGSSRLSSLKRPRVVYLAAPYSLRPLAPQPCSILDGFAPVLNGQLSDDEFVPQ